MKSKTLITLAIASAFGWSSGAFAGSGHHEVSTPMSVNETGPVLASSEAHSSFQTAALMPNPETPSSASESGSVVLAQAGEFDSESIGSSSSEAGGSVSGSYTSSDDFASLSTEDETMALADEDQTLALADEEETLAFADEGIYSDWIIVSLEPMAADEWSYYTIDIESPDQLAAIDEEDADVYVLLPSDGFLISAAEDTYVLVPAQDLEPIA